jgi:uncharacterized protein
LNRTAIQPGHWFNQLALNASQAIFHQWEQLEASGCIENFRIAAGESDSFREGWFFADSDAYKWLEAAARIQAEWPDPRLAIMIDDFIALLGRAQDEDGYIFTYNQIHFPGTRWQNLQIEHELYCHGHLIEAGVSHCQVSGRSDLLAAAHRAADRIAADFAGRGPACTPGHEEIEIALLRLHQVTPGDTTYLDLARQFIEQRGRTPVFSLSILRQNYQVGQRTRTVQQQKQEYLAQHPAARPFQLPPGNRAEKPANTTLRWYASALSGKYFQQHDPIRQQTAPVGHAVRFGYLQTAAAMLARLSGDRSLLPSLERAWEHMVTRRMYVTGGIGSLPGLEGFGRDYELDPEYAYAETCAALAALFWNWEMAELSGKAQYSDLFEWQLYNAASVGLGRDGTTYLYNNPLTCRGGVTRRPWYAVPCCPSNLSRTWADLGRFIFSAGEDSLTIHQYISSEVKEAYLPDDGSSPVSIRLESGLPWEGWARLERSRGEASAKPLRPVEVLLRHPSWAGRITAVGQGECTVLENPARGGKGNPTASGYDPRRSVFQRVTLHDSLDIAFEMPIELRRAHPKVKGHRGKAAVSRGPLVYCLESSDNPQVDIFTARLDPASLTLAPAPDALGGNIKLEGQTTEGMPLTFIPYYLWGNRGPSQMTVWVNV